MLYRISKQISEDTKQKWIIFRPNLIRLVIQANGVVTVNNMYSFQLVVFGNLSPLLKESAA